MPEQVTEVRTNKVDWNSIVKMGSIALLVSAIAGGPGVVIFMAAEAYWASLSEEEKAEIKAKINQRLGDIISGTK